MIFSGVGSSTIRYNELYIIEAGSFSLVESFPLLNIPIKFKFPFSKTEPLGNKIVLPFSPKMEERVSRTAGDALLIPSNTTIVLGYISLHQSSIFNGQFDLNFKIIFIAERIFYKKKATNDKIYLNALLSKNILIFIFIYNRFA